MPKKITPPLPDAADRPIGGTSTLRLKGPWGTTLFIGLLWFFLLAALLEIGSRSSLATEHLPAPSFGSGHRFLDLKLAQLQKSAAAQGRFDCIFLGPSTAASGIDPVVLGKAYKEVTGQTLRSFNFGIAGLNLKTALVLTRILDELYRPPLIVQTVFPADLHDKAIGGSQRKINGSSWIRYRLGEWVFEGFLIEHSSFYRCFLRFRQWLEKPTFSDLIDRKERTSRFGFNNFFYKKGFSPDERRERQLAKHLKDFKISAKRIADLNSLLAFHKTRRGSVILVEMPTHRRFHDFFARGKKDYREAAAVIARQAAAAGVVVIPAHYPGLDADPYWRDSSHLNARGAAIFSRELGKRLGEAVEKGLVQLPQK